MIPVPDIIADGAWAQGQTPVYLELMFFNLPGHLFPDELFVWCDIPEFEPFDASPLIRVPGEIFDGLAFYWKSKVLDAVRLAKEVSWGG